MQVKGRRMDLAGGVRTRSQIRAAGGEQYTSVPAPAKILAIVAQIMEVTQVGVQGPL